MATETDPAKMPTPDEWLAVVQSGDQEAIGRMSAQVDSVCARETRLDKRLEELGLYRTYLSLRKMKLRTQGMKDAFVGQNEYRVLELEKAYAALDNVLQSIVREFA